MDKYEALKFDETVCNKDMSVEEVILSQFFNDIENIENIDASQLFMPENEQEKMEEWMKSNLKRLQNFNRRILDKEFEWIKLDIFPSTTIENAGTPNK